MRYAKAVQERIDALNKYVEQNELKEFDIIHLYPKKPAYPNGYFDARFFDLHLFNTKLMQKTVYLNRDEIRFHNNPDILMVRIFADGSTLIRFRTMHKAEPCQTVFIQ